MASIALQLKNHHQKTLLKSTHNLSFSHLFSSDNNNNNNNSPKSSNFSSYFSDIKSRLKNEQQQQQQQPSNGPSRFLQQGSSNAAKPGLGLDDIRKNLSEFRLRSGQTLEKPEKPTYFSNLYSNKNEATNGRPIGGNDRKGPITFDAIRESLKQLKANRGNNQNQNQQKGNEPMSLNKYKENFRLSPPLPAADGGGLREGLPVSVFGRELRDRGKGRGEEEEDEDDLAKIAFVKQYNNEELGMKLRELRPEVAKEAAEKENWFSFSELNERLKKLREIEVSQEQAKGGMHFQELRKSLQKIEHKTDDERANRPGIQRFDILGRISGQNFSMSPPKEHLIEKYFHPDNMSSAEKLKLELKKVRDEFKMHESDCGSTRVQIAVLTTEILHLSSVLHKKDKHSRRGLLAKVQQRKKLLKYLRRTDWDSYCFVLSRLGLRDNPDYKH